MRSQDSNFEKSTVPVSSAELLHAVETAAVEALDSFALQNAPVRRYRRNSVKETGSCNMNHGISDEIPEFAYDSLARSLPPVIQQYYESDEGKRAFSEWKKKTKAAKKSTP